MSTFSYLYHFHHSDLDIVEIKRNLPADAPVGDVYKWLVIPHDSSKILPLRFQGMSQSGTKEFRNFAEGNFQFEEKSGTLNLMGREFNFERLNPLLISSELDERVKAYLAAL